MVATSFQGRLSNGGLHLDDPTFISWAVTNIGPGNISDDFFVDLLYDDVVVERWIVRGMPKNNSASITDWVELETRVNITAGEHKLKLVVDSTDLIPETNESDNVF